MMKQYNFDDRLARRGRGNKEAELRVLAVLQITAETMRLGV